GQIFIVWTTETVYYTLQGEFTRSSIPEEGSSMPKRRYERREPTHDWKQIQPLLKDTAQINYEVIRPVILWGQTPKERGAETGVSPRTIYYRANLFDQAGMASLLPPEPPPPVPKVDKRSLPPDIRQ